MIQLNIPSVDLEAATSIITEIAFAVAIIGILFSIWGFYRNNRVLQLRTKVNNLSYRLAVYFLQRENYEMAEISRGLYNQLPSYNRMLLSLRPLELEEYIDLDSYADGEVKRAMQQIDSNPSGAENIYRAIINQDYEE